MNAYTITNAENSVLNAAIADNDSARTVDVRRTQHRSDTSGSNNRLVNRVFSFIAELRRRQVCRTITVYSVALWLVCQIVDVVSGPLDLPDWTLRFIIVVGLIGFPITLILSWLFDVTREGVIADRPTQAVAVSRRAFDQVLDCTLVIAALIIGIQLATGILTAEVNAAAPVSQKIAVLPFQVAMGEDAEAIAHGLISELQHELHVAPGTTVIAARDSFVRNEGLSLTGAVSIAASTLRVTATLIDNETGEITWTSIFKRTVEEESYAPSTIAKDIVDALPQSLDGTGTTGASHAN